MKKFLAIILSVLILLSLAACSKTYEDGKTPYIQDGYWYIDGVNTGVKAEGVDGLSGSDGLDGINGKDGIGGIDGKTPYIQDGYWYIDGVNTGISAEGANGVDGNGILSVDLTSTKGYVDTYTITFTNGQTTTFTVTNGTNSRDEDSYNSFEVLEKKVDGYVYPSISIGSKVGFGDFSTHSKYVIPANVSVTITMKTGGSYGFARTDANDFVLESCSNSDCNYYTFSSREYTTYLYVSDVKVESINSWNVYNNDNYWSGKSIWWCGTSIPAGGYPLLVGNELGAMVYQESVGGSMCRANVSTGDYNGANISNITSSLSMTIEEANLFISNYDTLRSLEKNSSWPETLSESYKNRIVSGSFEKKLLPYLNGTKPMPDLFVIDHGHNDWKYKDVNGNIDIELEPTVENIQNGLLAEDTYMTANNYANLKKYFGDFSDFPEEKLQEFAASVNRNCYKGAVNFIVTLILKNNPQARIVFISNYEYNNGYNKAYYNVIDAQMALAEDWCFPICEVYKYLGYSDKIIPGTKEYMSEKYPEYDFEQDVTVYEIYNVDKVHPSSDTTGVANEIYAGIISSFLKTIR